MWRYPANLCQFYADVAVIWFMLVSSILHKRGGDFKSFLVVLRPCFQVLTTLVVVECSKVRQLERKQEMRGLPRDYEDLLAEHRTSLLAGYCGDCGLHCARYPTA